VTNRFSPNFQENLPFTWQATSGKNEWWRVAITLGVVVTASFLGNLPFVAVLAMSEPVRQRGFDINNFTPEALGVDPTLFLVLVLLPFVFGLFALWGCLHKIHCQQPKTLIQGSLGRIRWSRLWLGFGAWLILSAVSEYVSFSLHSDSYVFSFSAWAFAKTLSVVILMLPLQIAFEELLMRGYVLQQTTYYSSKPWLGLLFSTIIFGALHYQNPEVRQFGMAATAPYYLGVGLFLGILTILDDGLELALGIHLATNVFGTIFVNFKGSALPTPSLFQALEFDLPLMTALFVAQAFVFFLLFRRRAGTPSAGKMSWSWSFLTSKAPN